jgi:hypothetical protein
MRVEKACRVRKVIPAVKFIVPWLALAVLAGGSWAQAPTTPKEWSKGMQRTPPSPGTPTEVKLGFYVLNLGKIDQINETMDLVGLVTTSWTDPRLAFDASAFGERVARPAPDQIWMPELTIINAVNLQRRTPIQLSVRPDGKVKSIELMAMTVSTDYALIRFPFDRQTALVIWEALSSEVQPIHLVDDPAADGVSRESYVTLSEWDIEDVHGAVTLRQSGHDDLSFPRHTFKMMIKRNYGFYLFKVFFPLLLITIISWTVFWINPNTAFVPQMTVGMFSILTAITFNLTITSSLPRVPYATLLDGYIATCYMFFFAMILSVVYVHVMINRQQAERAMGLIRRLRWIFPLGFIIVQGASLTTFLFFL